MKLLLLQFLIFCLIQNCVEGNSLDPTDYWAVEEIKNNLKHRIKKNSIEEINARKMLVRVYFFRGELDKPFKSEETMKFNLKRLEVIRPDDCFTQFMWGMYHFTKGEIKASIKRFKEATKTSPQPVDRYLLPLSYAFISFLENNLDIAEKFVNRSLAIKDNYLGYFLLGQIYQKKHHYDIAMDYYKKSILKDTYFSYAYFYISKLYWEKEMKQDAMDYINKAHKINYYDDEWCKTRTYYHDAFTLEKVNMYKPPDKINVPGVKVTFEYVSGYDYEKIKNVKETKEIRMIKNKASKIVQEVRYAILKRCPYIIDLLNTQGMPGGTYVLNARYDKKASMCI